MNPAEPLQLAAATIGMVVALVIAFIPLTPGPILLWGVAILFGVSEGFLRVTPISAVIMSVLMLAGVSNDLWLPLFGVQTGGLTCLGAVGSFIGGIIGSFVIPIPILGTILGAMAGAALLELIRFREFRKGLQAGRSALKMIAIGYGINLATSISIFITYLISLSTTG